MTDMFGQRVIVHMPRVSWAYLDWLEEVEKCDVEGFFIDNDSIRLSTDGSIHDWMEGAVRTAFLRRELNGAPRPEWCGPANPSDFLELLP